MALIPGDQGQKAILSDGVQVDHIDENTLGHGVMIPALVPLAGSVVQVQVCNSGVRATSVASGSLVEVSSSYRVSITPRYSNSLITLQYSCFATGTATPGSAVTRISAKRFVSGTPYNVSSCGSVNGSRVPVAGMSFRGPVYDGNDPFPYIFNAIDFPNTTSTVQYGFYFSSESSQQFIFGQSTGDSSGFGVDTNILIIATEIKQ